MNILIFLKIFIELIKIPGFNPCRLTVNSGKIPKHKQILINFLNKWISLSCRGFFEYFCFSISIFLSVFLFQFLFLFQFFLSIFLSLFAPFLFVFQFFLSIFPFLLFQFFFFFFLFFNFFLFFLPFFIFFFLSFFPLLLPSYRIIIFFNNFLLFDFPKVVLSNNAVFEKVCFLMKLFP